MKSFSQTLKFTKNNKLCHKKCISLWMDLFGNINVFQQSIQVLGKQIGSIMSLVKLLVEKNGTICVRRSNGGL